MKIPSLRNLRLKQKRKSRKKKSRQLKKPKIVPLNLRRLWLKKKFTGKETKTVKEAGK